MYFQVRFESGNGSGVLDVTRQRIPVVGGAERLKALDPMVTRCAGGRMSCMEEKVRRERVGALIWRSSVRDMGTR